MVLLFFLNVGKYGKTIQFFQAATAGLGKYRTGD